MIPLTRTAVPLIPLLAAATQLFGDNVWLLRIPGVIAAAALVPLTASFSRLLGGNERSALIAGDRLKRFQ